MLKVRALPHLLGNRLLGQKLLFVSSHSEAVLELLILFLNVRFSVFIAPIEIRIQRVVMVFIRGG